MYDELNKWHQTAKRKKKEKKVYPPEYSINCTFGCQRTSVKKYQKNFFAAK